MINQSQKPKLTPEQIRVTLEKGTEIPFTGKYLNHNKDGTYSCVVCGNALFSSDAKFESGSGWPSFSDVINKGNVKLSEDLSHGMTRTEVTCASCGAHLGHVFDYKQAGDNGYYCINSCSLDFKEKE